MSRRKTISENDVQRICSALKSGFLFSETANFLGLGKHHVRYWANKAGVKSSEVCDKKKIKPTTRKNIELLLRTSGFSFRRIGQLTEVSRETVRAIYREIGSPERPKEAVIRCAEHGKSTVWPCPVCEVNRYLAGKTFRAVTGRN